MCGFETWSLTMREWHRLKVFENKVLRKIFAANRDRIKGEDTVIFCPCNNPEFISMSDNLKDHYEQCVRCEDTDFEHMLY